MTAMNPSEVVWLLHSILRCQRQGQGATLRDVIAFADYTNHAILTYREFSAGLASLTGLNLVHKVDGLLLANSSLMLKLPPFWEREKPDYEAERQWLAAYLATLPPTAALSPIDTTEAEFKAAVAAYVTGESN